MCPTREPRSLPFVRLRDRKTTIIKMGKNKNKSLILKRRRIVVHLLDLNRI